MTSKNQSKMSSKDAQEDPPSFEDVLEELGPLGKFQLVQIWFCYLPMLMLSFCIMSFVFMGYEPPHVCNQVNETKLLTSYSSFNTSPTVHYKSCKIEIIANDSAGKATAVDTIDCPKGHNFSEAKHTTYISEWELVCDSRGVAEVSQTLFNFGQMIGGFVATAIADRFGRKPVFIVSSFMASLAELCMVVAPNIFIIYALKFFTGIFYQSLVCVFFVYAMEFVCPQHREANGVIMCVVWIFDLVVVGGVAYFFRNSDWKYFQGAVGVSGIVCVLYPFFMYESPRWLAANNRDDEALRVLKKASKTNGVSFNRVKELYNRYVAHAFPSSKHTALITMAEQETESKKINKRTKSSSGKNEAKASILSIIRNKSLRKTTLIAWYLFTTNLFTYFGLYMASSDLAGDRFLNVTLMSLVEIPSCLCILVMMKKMSRRIVVAIFLSLTGLSLMASGILLSISDGSPAMGSLNTALFIFGKFSITASFNVIFIMIPEIYPTNLRSSAMGICSGLARVGAMVAPFLRPLFKIVKWGPALIFTVMCLLAAALTMLLPETKDVKLPDTVGEMNSKEQRHHKSTECGNVKVHD